MAEALGYALRGRIRGGDEGFHPSGHASGPDLLEIIRTIRPHILIPIHTLGAEYFVANLPGEGIEVAVPGLGEEMALTSGVAIPPLPL